MRHYIDIINEYDDPKIEPIIDDKLMTMADQNGFDTSRLWYHGSKSKRKFTKFKIPDVSRNGTELGRGVYVTRFPGTANVWAQGQGTVYACVLRKGKLVEYSDMPTSALWNSSPEQDDRWANPLWRECYLGFRTKMERDYGPGSDPGYREFAERMNKGTISIAYCLDEMGYIGATSRYSQIRGQAVIWNPDDVMIVGRAPGFDGFVYDPDE